VDWGHFARGAGVTVPILLLHEVGVHVCSQQALAVDVASTNIAHHRGHRHCPHCRRHSLDDRRHCHIAVFLILADPVDVKRGVQQCETASQPSIQPDKVDRAMGSCPRPLLEFDHIGKYWEDSNTSILCPSLPLCISSVPARLHPLHFYSRWDRRSVLGRSCVFLLLRRRCLCWRAAMSRCLMCYRQLFYLRQRMGSTFVRSSGIPGSVCCSHCLQF